MTHEQYEHSAQIARINDSHESPDDNQYVPVENATMSSHGPYEQRYSPSHRLSGEWIVQQNELGEGAGRSRAQEEERATTAAARLTTSSRYTQTTRDESYTAHRPAKRARTSFHHFATEARLQQYGERRRQILTTKSRVLRRSIALASRLQRTSSWIQDGLVEITIQQDGVGAFMRVFSHAQDLVDVCYSHWNNALQDLDTLRAEETSPAEPSTLPSFFDQLPELAQHDLTNLLSNLRSNPKFLVDKFRSLPLNQVANLTARPRWQVSEQTLNSLSQSSRGSAQRRRRVHAFAKELEDYATSFGRSDPLFFLLHNIYSQDVVPESPESQLRLFTWSTVCAELLKSRSESYNSLYWQVLEAFSTMQGWPAKRRMELFLMDVLQRGAFLTTQNTPRGSKAHLNTDTANEFFDNAVSDLYWTLIKCETGCFPTGALALAQAVLGKLSNETLEKDFRAHFFREWFFHRFLRAAIMFPENENMLMNVHISRRARDNILVPLFNRFAAKFDTLSTESTETVHDIIFGMIDMLDAKEAPNPYQARTPSSNISNTGLADFPMLLICASEVVKVLEILTPQAIHTHSTDIVLREMGNAFHAAMRPSTRFDMLKQELLHLTEPGTSAKDIHPCVENWAELHIRLDGTVEYEASSKPPEDFNAFLQDRRLSLPQKAVLRLCRESPESGGDTGSTPLPRWTTQTSLTELFQQQIGRCQASTQTADAVYWKKALAQLHRQYLLVKLPHDLSESRDDTAVLAKPLEYLVESRASDTNQCLLLENKLSLFEQKYMGLKRHSKIFTSCLEELRLKLWYTSEVTNSTSYVNAQNTSIALIRMSMSSLPKTSEIDASGRSSARPSSSRSSVASIFSQPRDDHIDLLMAPANHGGPRKLADKQIEAVRRWSQQYNIDNLCRGEERLHRFCMEIQGLAAKLTGETITNSPELWSSELFSRERSNYDFPGYMINSAPASTRPASTRPPSIFSDSLSATSTYPVLRPALRSVDSDVRSTFSDDRSSRRGSIYGLFQHRLNPQLLPPSLASSMGSSSHGRASSATTAASEIFSQPSQSVTSASVYSRPPSILHGSLPNFAPRSACSTREKKTFRDDIRKGLICLLLSDLGTSVFGAGCETDSWIRATFKDDVLARVQRQIQHDSLVHTDRLKPGVTRRQSTSNPPAVRHPEPIHDQAGALLQESQKEDVNYLECLQDSLDRISQHFDPIGKLQACVDFDILALQQLESTRMLPRTGISSELDGLKGQVRRNSFHTWLGHELADPVDEAISTLSITTHPDVSDEEVVQHFKHQLAYLQQGSLFRDLQYIAAFTPPEMLDRTAAGKAFVHLSMAALELKRDLCIGMVEVADQIMAANDNQKPEEESFPGSSLSRAAEYWKFAALNGNRVAQRELANLYLMHPELVPIITTPLSISSDIFKDDMMWQKKVGGNNSRQALCLALHWMQQAASQGDEIARKKLAERKGGLSIR